MGQYYNLLYKDANGKIKTNCRKIKGTDYIMAKLMEHSFLTLSLTDAVSSLLKKGKITQLAWVGDYADDDVEIITNGEAKYNDVWGDNVQSTVFKKLSKKYSYKGKYFVNHTRQEYLSFDEYLKTQKGKWKIYPVSLLTAIGNGRGCGDYYGRDDEMVGRWAWNKVGITKKKPIGYKQIHVEFFLPYAIED